MMNMCVCVCIIMYNIYIYNIYIYIIYTHQELSKAPFFRPMISTCSHLRSHLKFCGIKLGNRAHRTTNPKVQVNKASETTKKTTCEIAASKACWLVPMVGSDGLQNERLSSWKIRQLPDFQDSPESFVLPAPCGEPTGEINQTHCGLGGRVQLAHLKKSRCCIWDVGTIWEPSGNHLGKAEQNECPTLQLYAASLYWWKKRHDAMWNP